MNKQRRATIDTIRSKLEELAAEIESVKDEEQEAYDNLPESLQNGERGEAMMTAIENLVIAGSSIEEALDYLKAAQE